MIILGSASIGKTCLLQRYLTGDFKDDTISVGPTSKYIGSPCVSVVYYVSNVFLYSTAEYWCVSGIEKVGRLEYCFMGEFGVCVCVCVCIDVCGFISSNWYYLWWPFVNHLTCMINLCQSLVLLLAQAHGGVMPTKYSGETLVIFCFES